MFNAPGAIFVMVAVLVVLAILAVGIIGFVRGGEFNRKYGNRLMQLRIIAQFVALLLILWLIFLRTGGGSG